jgi:hypothetical protein
MTTKDKSGPAFPAEFVKYKPMEVGNNLPIMEKSPGMTLRDYFAAKALQGLLCDGNVRANIDAFAQSSYRLADAMMEARKA